MLAAAGLGDGEDGGCGGAGLRRPGALRVVATVDAGPDLGSPWAERATVDAGDGQPLGAGSGAAVATIAATVKVPT
jgi:hypothetical protein